MSEAFALYNNPESKKNPEDKKLTTTNFSKYRNILRNPEFRGIFGPTLRDAVRLDGLNFCGVVGKSRKILKEGGKDLSCFSTLEEFVGFISDRVIVDVKIAQRIATCCKNLYSNIFQNPTMKQKCLEIFGVLPESDIEAILKIYKTKKSERYFFEAVGYVYRSDNDNLNSEDDDDDGENKSKWVENPNPEDYNDIDVTDENGNTNNYQALPGGATEAFQTGFGGLAGHTVEVKSKDSENDNSEQGSLDRVSTGNMTWF